MNTATETKLVAIIGWQEGNAGQISSWLEKQDEYSIACFVHTEDTPPIVDRIPRDVAQFDYPTNTSFKGKPLISSSRWIQELKKRGISHVLITTDNMQERQDHIREARAAGMVLINAIHPSALIMEDAVMQDNIILHARAFIGYRAEIGAGVIINTGAQIDHHCSVRECATIDPAAILAGNVTIGRFTRVHTAAVVKNKISIGENSVIGAGAVIIEDVPDDVTVVGVPGKIIKRKGEKNRK